MQYSVINAAGEIEARIEATNVNRACRVWAERCWDEAVVEAAVAKAQIFPVASDPDTLAAYLDPYLVVPGGKEKECEEINRQLLRTDPHSSPNPPQGQPRKIDTGGRG